MDTLPADPLFVALRDGGQLTPVQVEAAARAFTQAKSPPELSEFLLTAGAITRYQSKKIQIGRTNELLFGSYLILDKIGEGGMGKVYRAVQLRTTRLVALKVVRTQLMANKTVLKRYEREAAAAARLDHPNIVRLYDAEMADGRYFLAMEYVEGLDLAKLVKQFGPLPYQEACEYVRQAALGLQHAHEQSLVHRDIKPSNVLVSGERALPGTNGKANVKVLDMGLVRSSLEEDDQPDLTRDGTVVGTPDYMSPEQATNSSQVGPQADIYSLGCTLYYLITGKPPYQDGTPVEKLIKHKLDPFPDIRKLVPSVPPGLARVLSGMVMKSISERISSAEAVSLAIAPYTSIGDHLDLFAPISSPSRSRYETVDLTPTSTVPQSNSALASLATVATPTPPTTRTASVAPASTRIARVKAVPLPVPDPDPVSAESLSTGESRRTPRSAGIIRVKRPKPKSAAKKSPVPLIVAAVVGVGLIVAAILIFGRSSPPPPPPPPVEPPKPVEAPPQPESPFRPIAELIPNHAGGVLLGHPRPLFERLEREAKFGGTYTRTLDRRLRDRFQFDPRKAERVVVAFTDDQTSFVASAEGGYVKPEWVQDLEKLPSSRVKLSTDSTGIRRLQYPAAIQPKSSLKGIVYSDAFGLALPGPPAAYLVSDRPELLNDLLNRKASGPADVSPELLREVNSVAKRMPVLAFVASGTYRLPSKGGWVKGDTLASLGISLLIAEVQVRNDRKLTVELTVSAITTEQLRDFFNIELPKRLAKSGYPELKPFAEAAVAVVPTPLTGEKPRMSLTVTLDLETVQTAIEAFLEPYAN